MKNLNKGYICYGTCYCDYTQKTCFSIINIFDQSKNVIILKLMSWIIRLIISAKKIFNHLFNHELDIVVA
jgi:hypothetical protein